MSREYPEIVGDVRFDGSVDGRDRALASVIFDEAMVRVFAVEWFETAA